MNRFESIRKPGIWYMGFLLTVLLAGCGGGQDPILGSGGSPRAGDLGILSPFGIASYGGITNTNSGGTTQINGDAVLNPTYTCNAAAVGSTNDFSACIAPNIPLNNPPGDRVVTPIFPDTTTAPAVTAALTARWNSLSPASMPGATVLGCGTIGSAGGGGVLIGCAGNATLPAGTYISATNSTIDVAGTLTLNGSATDVWVFQAPSALTTAVGSTILLTGGARASNVWWYVGSSATLNGSTTFNGNVFASASISMGNLATSCGRLLAGAGGSGAFALDTNTVSVPGLPSAPLCQ